MFFLAKVASGLSTVELQIQESRGSLVKDIQVLSELLVKLGKEHPMMSPWGGSHRIHLSLSKIQGSHLHHVNYHRLCSHVSPV